ncbi:MAG: hypothetical protein LBE22_07460 [Azoarcus sp.]|nr:hypothetical protein [Azoarcus sp.]
MAIGMTRIMETVNAVRKGLIACLSGILCLFCSISNAESQMKFEELIQKLDAANPWTVERVEEVLGSKLIETSSTKTFVIHKTGQLLFEENLIIEEVHLRLRIAKNELIRLIVSLSDEASCFTLDRIKESYPDIQNDPYGLTPGDSPNATFGYWTQRPWGHINFAFKMRRPKCLSHIAFIPKGEE